MKYVPQLTAPPELRRELENVARAFDFPSARYLNLSNTAAAPARPRDGDMVYTDGTWNPGGGGQGFYGYYGGAWQKLG